MPARQMRYAVAAAMLALGLPLAALTQNSGVLRITVTLTDAGGNVTPIPRVVLLVSANPATSEPLRVRTGPDGMIANAEHSAMFLFLVCKRINSRLPVKAGFC